MEAATPTRQARGQERVEQILRATLAVIGRRGVSAVTHRSVAEQAGVPLGSLTYYFASKQELLREALRLHVSDDAGRLRALADELLAAGASSEAVVEAFADRLESGHGDLAQFELYLEAARDPELRDVAAEALRTYADVAVVALRAAGVADPESAGELIVATIDGLSLHRRATHAADPEFRPILTRLLRALTGPSANSQESP